MREGTFSHTFLIRDNIMGLAISNATQNKKKQERFCTVFKVDHMLFFHFFQAAVATLRGSTNLLAVVSISALPNESVMERKSPQGVVLTIIIIILAGAKGLLLFLRKSTDIALFMMYTLS